MSTLGASVLKAVMTPNLLQVPPPVPIRVQNSIIIPESLAQIKITLSVIPGTFTSQITPQKYIIKVFSLNTGDVPVEVYSDTKETSNMQHEFLISDLYSLIESKKFNSDFDGTNIFRARFSYALDYAGELMQEGPEGNGGNPPPPPPPADDGGDV